MNAADHARAIGADCLCFRARRASRTITRLYDEALRPVGLQATQLTLLAAIAARGEAGQPMRRLVDILAMDLTTLSRNLRPLEKAGLITIGRLPSDRRVRVAWVTGAGAEKLVAARPLWDQAHRRVVEALGEEAAQALKTALDHAAAATRDEAGERGG